MVCIDGKFDIGVWDTSQFDTICDLLEPVHPTEIIVTTSQVNRASITTSEVNKVSINKSSVESSNISITE